MSVKIQLFLIILALISGAAAIFLSNRIMRKFKAVFLSSYFYFLIFIYIFFVYSIVGSQVIKFILENSNTAIHTIRSTEALLIAMGIPFLILAWYMFLRLTHDLFKEDIPNFFVLLYFCFFAISFIAYALFNLKIGGFETITFFMDPKQLLWTFTALMILIFAYALIFIFFNSRNLKDGNQRKAYRWFAIWYMLIISLSLASLHLSSIHLIFGLLFVVILSGFHIIPVLFLNIYLQNHYVEEIEDESFVGKLQQTIEKFDISKREAEIVELICKGMTNQEISDSLFISLQTVKDHVHRIFIKTGVKNRVQLTNLVGK